MLLYLKLIKFDNLLILAFAQLCIKFGLFSPFGIAITLSNFGIILLVIATILIAAAGNIIIAIYEQENKGLLHGGITIKSAYRLFVIFNVIGVLIGFYLANLVNKPSFAALFILVSGAFYMYATSLKELLVVKNLVIAILGALCLIVVGIFDLLPAITVKNRASQTVIFSIVLDYSIFAFIIIVMREIIKDCLFMNRDHRLEIKTIPMVLGKERALKWIGIVALVPIIAILYYVYTYLFSNTLAVIFALFILVGPLIYFMIRCFTAESHQHIAILKRLLKLELIAAAISLLFYQFILI
ncbi:UbiA family prenyltransferase [Aquimarina sp. U1-2]|uniref:geranylgeranylglycerol-phosphate geranylgeranyltransferase n=1 Tax=Aquimarina sp. U1-2 TaxID=2823141 RepID=UPI001AECD827|nr:geranylgeranylglycerol-phosphate geranylgeranyltransferase [Aquimarina sp. U1-2]MBP2832100.1 UbiA family prenyltransferase [Aquimarina sp. U1-2]